MPPVGSTYIPYAEINNDVPSTIGEFRAELSKFVCESVVYVCSVINIILRTWGGGRLDVDAHEELVRNSFPPDIAENLIKMSKLEMGTRRIFHRQQLLFVAKEAILHCPSRGLDPLTSPAWGGLGVSFLMANDHLHFSYPSPDDSDEKMVNTLADLIPVGEYSGWHSVINKITRSYLMSTRILDSMRKHSDFVDLNTEFSKIAGITPIEYQSLCFGALSKYIRMDIASYRKHPQSFLLPRTFFNPTHIVQERVDQFLEDLSSTPEKFREAFGKRNVGHNDFTSLRDKPLFQQEGNFYAIDAGFLAEKLETGAFWRVHNSYNSNRDKKRLHAFWGAVFQEYSNWLVRNSVDGVKIDSSHCPSMFRTAMKYAMG